MADSSEDSGTCCKILLKLRSIFSRHTVDFCLHSSFSGIRYGIHRGTTFDPEKTKTKIKCKSCEKYSVSHEVFCSMCQDLCHHLHFGRWEEGGDKVANVCMYLATGGRVYN